MSPLSTARLNRLAHYAMAGTACLMLTVAGVWSLSLGYSDLQFRSGTVDTVHRAALISPGDAAYIGQSSLLENAAKAQWNLEKAVALNSYYSWAWIQLGLAAESRGDVSDAEDFLLRAAQVDHLYGPRWVLCDFYYRQAKFDLFWYWVHQALEIDESDSLPIFRLAARVLPDPEALSKQIAPSTSRIAGNLASFLAGERPVESAAPVVAHEVAQLIPRISPEKSPSLITYAGKLLDAGDVPGAIAVWNALCRRGFLPFAAIDLARGNLTNADFSSAPSGRGFDWHLITIDGVTADFANGQVKLTFSRDQPDQGQILFQRVPVVAGQSYEFHFRNQFASTHPSEGFKWKVYRGPATSPKSLLAESIDLTNATWKEQTLAFRGPHDPLVVLSLEFQRPRGATRLAGVATFEQLSLKSGSVQ